MKTSVRSRIVTTRPPAATTSPACTSLYSTRPDTGVRSTMSPSVASICATWASATSLAALASASAARAPRICAAATRCCAVRRSSSALVPAARCSSSRRAHLDLGEIVLRLADGDVGLGAGDAGDGALHRGLGGRELGAQLGGIELGDDRALLRRNRLP